MAERHAPRTLYRLVHLLKNPPRILQEQLARRADFHAAAETVEQLEADLAFQILERPVLWNLSGQVCSLDETDVTLEPHIPRIDKDGLCAFRDSGNIPNIDKIDPSIMVLK